MIEIDGSQGEGGGQIVRSSLTLSAITSQPIKITNLRSGRKKPGLKRQHLTAVRAAAKICGAAVHGDVIGSKQLKFEPQEVAAGDYYFRVGTAGSATLVLQTVLPALLTASGESKITLEGGTHNPWAPPFDFLAKAYLPLLNRMGPHVEATLLRPGFYPAGGGRFVVAVQPREKLASFDLIDRGPIKQRRVIALARPSKAESGVRQRGQVLRRLARRPANRGVASGNARLDGLEPFDENRPTGDREKLPDSLCLVAGQSSSSDQHQALPAARHTGNYRR